MRVWVRTDLLCIHFDGWKVSLDTWPIPLVEFRAIVIDKVLEHIRESRCIFVAEELHNVRNDPEEVAYVLGERCRFFIQHGTIKAEEIKDLALVEFDDNIFVTLSDWRGTGYDTELLSDESEIENTDWEECLVEGEESLISA